MSIKFYFSSFVGFEDFQDHCRNSKLYPREGEYFEWDFMGEGEGEGILEHELFSRRERNRCEEIFLHRGRVHLVEGLKGLMPAGASSLLFHSAAKFYFHFIFLSRSISLFLSSRYVTDPINKVASLVFQLYKQDIWWAGETCSFVTDPQAFLRLFYSWNVKSWLS